MNKLRLVKKILAFIAVVLVLHVIVSNNFVLKSFFSEKVWAHKTNSPEKAQINASRYFGIEIDVVFNDTTNQFDVYHPPFKGYKCSLNEIFEYTSKNDKLIYWIDFKNLNKKNQIEALREINRLVSNFGIRPENIIIESTNFKYLLPFKENGIKTSYYLPQKLALLRSEELKIQLERITQNIRQYNPNYISSDYSDYKIIKQYFPDEKKLFWFTVYGNNNKLKTRVLLYRMLNDDNVKGLLIPN